jgi:hypothetical protein
LAFFSFVSSSSLELLESSSLSYAFFLAVSHISSLVQAAFFLGLLCFFAFSTLAGCGPLPSSLPLESDAGTQSASPSPCF